MVLPCTVYNFLFFLTLHFPSRDRNVKDKKIEESRLFFAKVQQHFLRMEIGNVVNEWGIISTYMKMPKGRGVLCVWQMWQENMEVLLASSLIALAYKIVCSFLILWTLFSKWREIVDTISHLCVYSVFSNLDKWNYLKMV